MNKNNINHQYRSKSINYSLYSGLKEISVKKGFQKENRQKVYSLLFKITYYPLEEIIFDSSSLTVKHLKSPILPIKIIADTINANNNGIEVLKKDIPRSIYNQIQFNAEREQYMPINLNKLELPLTCLFNSKSLDYYYYQGFLDFTVYAFLLFPENKSLQNICHPLSEAFAFINRLSELLLKDYLVHPSKVNDLYIQATNFLIDIIGIIDKKLSQLIIEEGNCLILILSWTITLMTHNLQSIEKVYRLLDYLILAEPYAIYVLSAIIIAKELKLSINKGNVEDNEDFNFNIIIQSIDLNCIINNDIILEAEDFIEKHNTEIEKIRLEYIQYFPTMCNPKYHGLIDFLFPKH